MGQFFAPSVVNQRQIESRYMYPTTNEAITIHESVLTAGILIWICRAVAV